jgi:hypothetical protein
MTAYLEFSIGMSYNDSFSLFCCFNGIFNDIYNLLSTETCLVYQVGKAVSSVVTLLQERRAQRDSAEKTSEFRLDE